MVYDKLRLKVADYGCILLVNMPTAARFDTATRCEDWVGASPHGAAVGVFFLCPSVLFSRRRRTSFCQEVFYGKFDG